MANKKLALIDGTYGDLKVANNVITRGGQTVFALLGNMALLDLKARQSSNPAAHLFLDALSAQAAAAKTSIRYVDDIRSFFNPKARFDEFLKTGDPQGIELTEEEQRSASILLGIQTKFNELFTLPTPPYPMAEVPANRRTNPLLLLAITDKSITRNGYVAKLTEVEALWKIAAKYWLTSKKGQVGKGLPRVAMAGYNKWATISHAQVTIGCQTIKRWELEQVAVKFGWEFPSE